MFFYRNPYTHVLDMFFVEIQITSAGPVFLSKPIYTCAGHILCGNPVNICWACFFLSKPIYTCAGYVLCGNPDNICWTCFLSKPIYTCAGLVLCGNPDNVCCTCFFFYRNPYTHVLDMFFVEIQITSAGRIVFIETHIHICWTCSLWKPR